MLKYYEAPGQFVASFEGGDPELEASTKAMIEKKYGESLNEITKEQYDELLPKYKNA